ncbi:General transcription factor IIE subunit 1 isoform 3 [Carex littledalei]|uniref:General transcription factor IIE subunit 1 isoform 3 n=1 Tax=Carex littledalei TaxID=544730 RepID=A0A833QU09_9POAL|nr:General transcription factor IIE subunit 1 isoform 3 [Carex littledalei]
MSLEPFNRLVKLAARAFYDDITMKGDNQPKTGRGDNRGIAVVVLDALTRRQWVREEDLAKALKLHSKQLRRILRFFEEEKFVTRDHRKESAKGAKIFSAAVAAAAGDGRGKEGEEKVKLHTHSYCCLDYAQIYDVVRYRIHKMKKKLKDELDSRNTVQTYICPNCAKRYSAFDALQLISYTDDLFHCERCDGELVAESDKLAADEMGEGDDNRSRRREKLKDLLQRIEEQLKPVTIQIARVKDLPVPDFGTLQQWEVRASAAGWRGYGEIDPNDANKSSQGYGGTPMPSLGDTKVEVDLGGGVKEEVQSEGKPTKAKVLPPWMIKKGMVLTKEQRGETSLDAEATTQETTIDDKKQADLKDDDKSLMDEYTKAYYAAYYAKIQEEEGGRQSVKQEEFGVSASDQDELFGTQETSSHRQVGMKSKRRNAEASYKLAADLNMEAKESEEEEEDNIDWEDG